MEQIYLIEDCNALKYVGRTKKKINYRLNDHKRDKKKGIYCSSSKLDLENCEITCIDIADSKEEARELEEFYINSIDCVNDIKLNQFDPKEYRENHKDKQKEYNKKYREKNKEYFKKYFEKNKDKITEYQKEYHKKNKKSQIQL